MVAVGLVRDGPGHRRGGPATAEQTDAAKSWRIADFCRKCGSLARPVSLGKVFCQAPLSRVVWPQSAYRPRFDGVDRQGPAADAPTRLGQRVVIVVAQMPDDVDDPVGALIPVMRDAGDASPRDLGPRGCVVDLAD